MKSHSNLLLPFLAPLLLVGCAMRSTLPPLDARDPGSPDAPEAAVPEPMALRHVTSPESRSASAPLHHQHQGHEMHGNETGDPKAGDAGGSR